MPAFLCNPRNVLDAEDYGSRVVFAVDQAAAEVAATQGRFADYDADEFEWYVTRRPEWDKYESTGFGTQEMVDEGWRVPCWHCEHNVNREDEEGNPVDRGPVVVVGEFAYCDQKCRDAELSRHAAYQARKEAAIAKAKDLLGDEIEILYASGASRHGWCECKEPDFPGNVDFKFPGSLGTASGCPWCNGFGCERRDIEAWTKWRKSKQKGPEDGE